MSVTNNLNASMSQLQNQMESASSTAQSDIASGNMAGASSAMAAESNAMLGIQQESAIQGEIEDTIKAIIQNESKA